MAGGRARSERRRQLGRAEVDALLDAPDPAPDPEAVLLSRSDLEALQRVLLELPPRQREILLSARVEGISGAALAERFGVSTRTIELELRRALDFCAAKIDREVVQRFGPPRRAASLERKEEALLRPPTAMTIEGPDHSDD